MTNHPPTLSEPLSPMWVRIVWFAILGIIAAFSIVMIDTRAMQRQSELIKQYPAPPAWMTEP